MSRGFRERTKSANAAMSKDAPSGRSGAGAGIPPATSIMARYVGNPGSGYTTVSPGLTSASVGKNKPGFAPGPTTTSSGLTATPLVSETCAAMASRNEGAPSGAAYLVLPPRMASTPASTMCVGVANPGWPISRWTISRPSRSNAVALASTAYAPSFCRVETRSLESDASPLVAPTGAARRGARRDARRADARAAPRHAGTAYPAATMSSRREE